MYCMNGWPSRATEDVVVVVVVLLILLLLRPL